MVLVSVSLLISVHESERKITWYLMKGSLYKSFLQMCFKNAFLRKSLVPKVLFVISIITVAISGLHIQKENSYLKITATYWTENSGEATKYNYCVLVSACFHMPDSTCLNKLTNQEVIFLTYRAHNLWSYNW